MALVEIKMPQMGESVMEATIISWLKKEGDFIREEEPLLEVATDKVDTEVPSMHEGIINKLLAKEGDVVQIGHPIAIMNVDAANVPVSAPAINAKRGEVKKADVNQNGSEKTIGEVPEDNKNDYIKIGSNGGPQTQPRQAHVPHEAKSERFYSPLVRNIAREENITISELDSIQGSGKEGRVTKDDIMGYLTDRKKTTPSLESSIRPSSKTENPVTEVWKLGPNEEDEVMEMDRVRKIIAERMVESRRTSAHVHSFVEADISNIVKWKKKHEAHFAEDLGVRLTYSPIFIEAIVKALKDYPMMNISVEGEKIIKKKRINMGLAVALGDGNLIVPVIKDADQLNLVGLARQVNDLANRARKNQIGPDEITGSTYTMTNVGSFGSTMGTPIILQPNVGILAIGAIEKKVSVVETEEYGDVIAIRNKVTLSHSYDHRVVDGALGSLFVRRVADYLEDFDIKRTY